MYISLDWLREYVELPKDIDAEELGELLTVRSAEVEQVIDQKKVFEKIVVGKVIEIKKHPNADKLKLAQVDIGKEKPVQIVCGGSNLKKGLLGPVALPGATVKWHGEEVIEMKVAKVRGEESHGMICTPEELGLQPLEDERELMDLTELKAKPGTPLAKALGQEDIILEFDNKSLTHRPDLWSHRGIAREIAAVTEYPFKDKSVDLKFPKKGEEPNIMVNAPELCPRYMGLIIRGVKVEESPQWLKNRLLTTDHSIISNIVDVTNYVMEEIGQPMHAFDLSKVDGGIIVRTAHKGESMTTLDGEKQKLDESMLLIADKKKPLAIAGVMGGEFSGINEDTVDILLESANFDPVSVRRTSTKLGLRTDSVQRFEKGLDPNQCELAIMRAAELILKLCPGAKIAGTIGDAASFDTSEPLVAIDAIRIQEKIGVPVPIPDMANFLGRLGFEVQGASNEGTQNLLIKIPSYRATKDVDIEEDIVEEVARLYGYENIPAKVPELPSRVPKANYERRNKHDAREIFAHALGYNESYNYSFYSKERIAVYGLDEKSHLKLENILSEDQSHLRTSLIPNLIQSLREAAKYDAFPALFEIGRTYEELGQFMPKEVKRIAGARLFNKNEPSPFSHVKGDLEEFFELFNINSIEFVDNKKPANFMHPYQNAIIKLRGKEIGTVFTLHPVLTEDEDFIGRIAAFELDFEALSKARAFEKHYIPESKYPAIEFDISVVVDRKVLVADLEEAMQKAIKGILKSIELFDSYEGEGVDKDKKSLAFRLTLQANDRTLTSSDLEEAQKAAWSALEKLGGKIRGLE